MSQNLKKIRFRVFSFVLKHLKALWSFPQCARRPHNAIFWKDLPCLSRTLDPLMQVSTVGIIHDLKQEISNHRPLDRWDASGLGCTRSARVLSSLLFKLREHLRISWHSNNSKAFLVGNRFMQIPHAMKPVWCWGMISSIRLSSLIPSGNGQVPILRVTFSVRPDLLLLTRCLKPNRSNSAENV